ncbi:MAG: hypothetical protein OEY23_07800 [Acidimicrobiia bacterium]|nr:hypothetical protein [Acidimicrobiia bacterium]
MLFACWSVKGGSGVSVVAAALALELGRACGAALLVDLDGDAEAVLGLAPSARGVAEWLAAASPSTPPGRGDPPEPPLAEFEVPVTADVGLIGRGAARLDAPGADTRLLGALDLEQRPVVVDCGLLRSAATAPAVAGAVAAGAPVSLLVMQPCYLAIRRAVVAPLRPSGVVLVREHGRALGERDVSEVLGLPVVADVRHDPAVARAVDAGILVRRTPSGLTPLATLARSWAVAP